jgi:hypothetical protein
VLALLGVLSRPACPRWLAALPCALPVVCAAANAASARKLVSFELSRRQRAEHRELASLESYPGLPRLQLQPCARPAAFWSWLGRNQPRWRDPSGRDVEEWFLGKSDRTIDASLAISGAASMIATLVARWESRGSACWWKVDARVCRPFRRCGPGRSDSPAAERSTSLRSLSSLRCGRASYGGYREGDGS